MWSHHGWILALGGGTNPTIRKLSECILFFHQINHWCLHSYQKAFQILNWLFLSFDGLGLLEVVNVEAAVADAWRNTEPNLAKMFSFLCLAFFLMFCTTTFGLLSNTSLLDKIKLKNINVMLYLYIKSRILRTAEIYWMDADSTAGFWAPLNGFCRENFAPQTDSGVGIGLGCRIPHVGKMAWSPLRRS